MEVIPLPGARLDEGAALKQGLVVISRATRRPRVAVLPSSGAAVFCASCAGAIEFGAVMRGLEAYCSVECSLGGDRPA
jgi:hypothetical protein